MFKVPLVAAIKNSIQRSVKYLFYFFAASSAQKQCCSVIREDQKFLEFWICTDFGTNSAATCKDPKVDSYPLIGFVNLDGSSRPCHCSTAHIVAAVWLGDWKGSSLLKRKHRNSVHAQFHFSPTSTLSGLRVCNLHPPVFVPAAAGSFQLTVNRILSQRQDKIRANWRPPFRRSGTWFSICTLHDKSRRTCGLSGRRKEKKWPVCLLCVVSPADALVCLFCDLKKKRNTLKSFWNAKHNGRESSLLLVRKRK